MFLPIKIILTTADIIWHVGDLLANSIFWYWSDIIISSYENSSWFNVILENRSYHKTPFKFYKMSISESFMASVTRT